MRTQLLHTTNRAVAGAVSLFAPLLLSTSASALTCYVDPTGGSGYAVTYPSVNNAIAAGGCGAAGSVIEIWCPLGGCTDQDVVLSGLTDIVIRSQEVGTPGAGPIELVATLPAAALRIESSSNITVEGIDSILSGATAVEVLDSSATLKGLATSAVTTARYTQVTGQQGMAVGGASVVTIQGVGFTDSGTGLRVASTLSGEPQVTASAVAFLRNDLAIGVSGPMAGCAAPSPGTVLTILGDFSVAWENYVMENIEGIEVQGRAIVSVDHTIFASNLTQLAAGGRNPLLIHVADSARFLARNVLIYDNDMIPGLTPAYSGLPNVAGYVLLHASCDSSTFQASTIVNNGADITFGVGGSGLLKLDHTVVTGNWGKTLSMSGYYVAHGSTCPPLTMSAAYFWNNSVTADPAVCLPPTPGLRVTWDPSTLVSPATPRTLSAYPSIAGPFSDLYLIRIRQPVPAPIPSDLFYARRWSVNGTRADRRRLDAGYHNPI